MRDINTTEELSIPEGVFVSIKSRIAEVKGPRGKLTKNLRHINMDIQLQTYKKGDKPVISLTVWQGGRKHVACLRTIRSLINNMIIGVTKVLLTRRLKVLAFADLFPLLLRDTGL